MKITIKLFGAYRIFGENLKLNLPQNAVVLNIREEIIKILKDKKGFTKDLLKSSRFANEVEILSENHALNEGDEIAIIPPVAGG